MGVWVLPTFKCCGLEGGGSTGGIGSRPWWGRSDSGLARQDYAEAADCGPGRRAHCGEAGVVLRAADRLCAGLDGGGGWARSVQVGPAGVQVSALCTGETVPVTDAALLPEVTTPVTRFLTGVLPCHSLQIHTVV